MVEVPDDHPVIIAQYKDVVWSRTAKTMRVRYGCQITNYKPREHSAAMIEFATCIRHQAECEGLLDASVEVRRWNR